MIGAKGGIWVGFGGGVGGSLLVWKVAMVRVMRGMGGRLSV